MTENTEKLLVEIAQELKHQSKLNMFIAISGVIVGLYLIVYTIVLILASHPRTDFVPLLEFAFTDSLVILALIIITYAISLKISKKPLKWVEEEKGGN